MLKAVPGTNNLDATLLLPGDFPGNLKLETDRQVHRYPRPGGACEMRGHEQSSRARYQERSRRAAPTGWSETWLAEACGVKVEAEVIYSATATGMTYRGAELEAALT